MTIGVVPIFVNAGAALLPALLAGLTSLVAILVSPRALASLCRRKPWVPASVVAIGVGLYFSPRLFPSPPPILVATTNGAGNNAIDWPMIAREMLRQEQAGAHGKAILSPLWRNDLDKTVPLSTPAFGTDAAGKTTIYLPTTLLDTAGKFGVLYAIDAKSGKTAWTASNTGAPENGGEDLKPFFSSPAISADGTRLTVGQGLHDDANCPLLCVDVRAEAPTSGNRVLWSVKTPLHVESSPAIFKKNGRELAVVGAGAIEGPDRLAKGNPGFVFCVDVATGKQLWEFPLYDPESSPAVDEDGVIFIGSGFNGNAVAALECGSEDVTQVRQVWKTPTPYPAVGDVTLATHEKLGKILLIGIGNGDYVYSDPKPAGLVMALERSSGKILWQTPMPDSVLGRLKVTQDNRVLAGCRDGQAYALDLETGKILWQKPVSKSVTTAPVLAGLAADETRAYALAADGTLAVLRLSDGELLESMKLSDESKLPQGLSMSTPVCRDGVLYVGTETMGLQAFKVRDEKPVANSK